VCSSDLLGRSDSTIPSPRVHSPQFSKALRGVSVLPAEAFHGLFRIRFRNLATSGDFDDWFVDDVRIEIDFGCVSDVDMNGVVNFNDLVETLFHFGEAGGPGDADGSGLVDFNDLVYILFDFGPCESPSGNPSR